MPSFTVKTKRTIVLGVILLACVGALVGQYEILGVAVGGLLALLQDDKDFSGE